MRAHIHIDTVDGGRDIKNTKSTVLALIDPGSDNSIIELGMLPKHVQHEIEKFRTNRRPQNSLNIKLHKNCRIKTINSDNVVDCVSVMLNVHLDKWSGECDFIVLDSMNNEKIILGADFITRHEASLSYLRNKEQIRFPTHNYATCFCKTTDDEIIPPNSQRHITVFTNQCYRDKTVVINPFDHSKQGFVVANSLNRVDNTMHTTIRLINPTDESITIPKNQCLGEVSVYRSKTIRINSTNSSKNKSHNFNINTRLRNRDKTSVLNVLKKYINAFGWSDADFGRTNVTKHEINLNTDKHFKLPAYKVPQFKEAIISDKVRQMKNLNVIEESRSPFSSPVVLAKKKNGEWRFCVDFRTLNSITTKDAYPLPRIDDTLRALHGNRYFSILDLLSGFWQIPLAQRDKHKTAFVTRDGLFQFKVMPFGLTNAPATFQRLMDKVLNSLTWKFCIVYLDDIVVFGRTIEEHNRNLALVLEQIIKAKLKLRADKCKFAQEEVIYLGHKINQFGIGTDPSKIEVINRISTPTDRMKLRRFLGACSYYRKFVKNFSEIALPLYRLTSSKAAFRWTAVEQSAFEKLKEALKNTPVLVAPDFSKPFDVYCDASTTGQAMGAVLQQSHGVIAYASRHFNDAELKYSINDKEALAVLWASKHFKQYIYGQQTTFYTDHKPLADLKINRSPEESLGRVTLKLQGLNYDIRYVRGVSNTVADMLSRDVERETTRSSSGPAVNSIEVVPIDWAIEQQKDEQLIELKRALIEHRPMSLKHSPYGKSSNFNVVDGVVRKNGRVVVPRQNRDDQIKKQHEFYGHEQTEKLYRRLNRLFYWPAMYEEIRGFVKSCDTCQRTKSRQTDRIDLGNIVDASKTNPLEFWSIDLQGPFRTSSDGSRYIVVAIDYITKWVEAACIPDATAVTTAKFILNNIILRHGVPKKMSLLSDQGSNFESKLVRELCDLYGIHKMRSSPYHPSGNGAVERENKSIKELLRSYTLKNKNDWHMYVPQVVHARNTTIHSSTGFSPYEIVYSKRPCDFLPTDIDRHNVSEYVEKLKLIKAKIEQIAARKIKLSQDKNKQYHSSSKQRQKYTFVVGDLVLMTNKAQNDFGTKLDPKFVGPFEVLKLIGQHDYRVKSLDSTYEKVVHHNRLVPYKSPTRPSPSRKPRRSKSSGHVRKDRSRKDPPTDIRRKSARDKDRPMNARQTHTRYGRAVQPVSRYRPNNINVSCRI